MLEKRIRKNDNKLTPNHLSRTVLEIGEGHATSPHDVYKQIISNVHFDFYLTVNPVENIDIFRCINACGKFVCNCDVIKRVSVVTARQNVHTMHLGRRDRLCNAVSDCGAQPADASTR